MTPGSVDERSDVRTLATIGNRRNRAVSALVLLAALAAIVSIVLLQQRADASRASQVSLEHVSTDLDQIQWSSVSAMVGGEPAASQKRMAMLEARVTATIAKLRADRPVPALTGIDPLLRASFATGSRDLAMLSLFTTGPGRVAIAAALTAKGATGLPAQVRAPLARGQRSQARLLATLDRAGQQYDVRATAAKRQAMLGSGAAIVLLLLAFLLTHRRSVRARAEAERLAAENAALAAENRREALTDALTGLGNRRALIEALGAVLADADLARPFALSLFDLDGFKQYNDSYGHPAGDALLTRLGERLTETLEGIGTAFRMGGDEFCILAPVAGSESDAIARLAAAALSQSGAAYEIGCSYGVALLPAEARTVEAALRLADQRMYAQKAPDRHDGDSASSRASRAGS